MEDGDAEVAVGVDVGVVERAGELECGWGVGVVGGEGHGGEEVAAVVEGVGVEDYEADLPGEDVVVFELGLVSGKLGWMVDSGVGGLTSTLTHFSWARDLYSFINIRSAMIMVGRCQRGGVGVLLE